MTAQSQNIQQAESWLIGQLLASPENLMNLNISIDHFTIESHRRMFTEILKLESENKLIDVISVAEELDKKYPNEYWLSNLGQYQHDSFSPTFFKSSQTVMIENYRKRKINEIILNLQNSYDSDSAIKELMTLDHTEKNYSHTMPEAAMLAIELAEKIASRDGVPGLTTGLLNLDKTIGGFQSPDLYVIGARPAMGKTSVILNFMLNHNESVGFFSTEQPNEQIGLRAISATSSVPARKIRTADFNQTEMNSMSAAVAKLAFSKIHIYDKGYLTLNELMREARRMKHNHDVKAIYVDYIQRIKTDNKDRRLEVSEVVTSLKSLARELQIPVIGLAQVNRSVEQKTDKRPHMGDLLESGVIEQEADVVMLLYRDEVYNDESPDKGVIEILIDKNRHGVTGKLKFAWLGETMQIKNLAQY